MENRNFLLDTEWSMIHYPDKPSGFGILIIGDERHFVHSEGSFWTQNEGKFNLIKKLNEEGYTIFYSNLYGKNWGSDKAVRMAKRLYEHMMRTEILNGKIHLIAEGMGALIALKLMHEMSNSDEASLIRTCVLINPILSLKDHLEQEREHYFFYKNLVKELAMAFEMDESLVPASIQDHQGNFEKYRVPVKIIHVLKDSRAYKQAKRLKALSVNSRKKELPISICYLLPEKSKETGSHIIKFLKRHELIL